MTTSAQPAPTSRYRFQLLTAESETTFSWRLLSANNRPVATSALDYPAMNACRADIDELQADIADAEFCLRAAERGKWRWSASLGGRALARSSLVYDRQNRCADGARKFAANVGQAQVEVRILVMRHHRTISRYGAFALRNGSGGAE